MVKHVPGQTEENHIKHLIQDSQLLGQDSNPGPAEYEAGVLITTRSYLPTTETRGRTTAGQKGLDEKRVHGKQSGDVLN